MWRTYRKVWGARPEAGKHCNNLKDRWLQVQLVLISFIRSGEERGSVWKRVKARMMPN